ncbi:MAG: hypothetical protein LH474_06540 [Chamaesiphon sp.]|nr:hypothetical protein [Chamaesiphon sp.]
MSVNINRGFWTLLDKARCLFTTNFSIPIIVWSLAGSLVFGLIYAVIHTVNIDLAIAIERWFQQLEISILTPESTALVPAALSLDLTAIKIAFLVAIVTIASQTFPKKNS